MSAGWLVFQVTPHDSPTNFPICSDAQAVQFKGQVYLAVHAMAVFLWGGIALAVLMALSALACLMAGYLRHRAKARYTAVATAGYYAQFYQPLDGPGGNALESMTPLDSAVDEPPRAARAQIQ